MAKSTHKAEVVPVVLEPHPNADSLSVVRVWGYSCVVRTADWVGVDKGIYLPPDSCVDVSRPEFNFLGTSGTVRIKARKLRGIVSFGLLIPAPPEAQLDDDWAERLGVWHYEPPIRSENRGGLVTGGEAASAPDVYAVKYDVEAGRRYAVNVFAYGEPVIVSEKIHGTSSRYVFVNGQIHCGSRTEWKKEYPNYDHVTVESLEGKVGRERAEEIVAKLQNKPKTKNLWWQALDATPSLRLFCEANPGLVVYGEVYGAVQDLNYGHAKGQVSFAAFDVMRDGRWLDFEEAYRLASMFRLPWVPLLNEHGDIGVTSIAYDFDRICEMAEGPSLIAGADHLREGVVVRPTRERYHPKLGRVCLKWVNPAYLERSK